MDMVVESKKNRVGELFHLRLDQGNTNQEPEQTTLDCV
jgi:hypothetical protein